ncbi:MAG: NfeD family protein [Tepidisphaeraceae bacterium]
MLLAITAGAGPLGWAYLACLLLGLIYGAMAGLFGLFGHHHDFDHGFDSPGHSGPEVQGMGHEPGAADSGMHMSLTNPIVLVSFGGGGLATMQLLGWGTASLVVAASSGLVLGAATFALFNQIFRMTQGSSGPREQEVIGNAAEVITPIPVNGLGEIAYTRRGSRFTAPARAESGDAVPKQSIVTITRIVGHTYYIRTPQIRTSGAQA